MEVTRDELAKSLSPAISKICIGERLYSVRGEPVAEIGKAVLLEAARSPAKLDVPRWAEARHPKGEKGEGLRAPFPDLEDSWLDLKGGFLDGEGKTSQFHPGALNCLDIGHRQIRRPLFAAGWRNDTALIKLLVESGASVSHEGDGMSPLAAAVGFGYAEAVMMLLDHGAPTDPKNWNGDEWETLADLAIRHRQYDLAGLLLQKGYQPSDRQVTEWISWGDLKRVASLVDNGFDLGEMEAKLILAEIEDPRGWPASTSLIHYALECSDSDTRNKMIELLVANGARVKEIPNYVPQVEAIRRGQKDSAALLVKLGADPNERFGQLLNAEQGPER